MDNADQGPIDGATVTPKRPALRYHGGKWLLAPWIIAQFPAHRVYVEPFGGAASVLIRKPRSYAEVYNDLDGEIVDFFRVLQNHEQCAELLRLLTVTPFAREEFNRAYDATDDPVERARRLVIRSYMGFGSDGCNDARPTGFRAKSNRSGAPPAADWANFPPHLARVARRFTGVVIEHRPAIEVIRQHDGPGTLFYCDPPYVHETRSQAKNSAGKNYRHEMTDDDHTELARQLALAEGAVIISGYDSDLYADLYAGWRRCEKMALADGARERKEVLWLNAKAAETNLLSALL